MPTAEAVSKGPKTIGIGYADGGRRHIPVGFDSLDKPRLPVGVQKPSA